MIQLNSRLTQSWHGRVAWQPINAYTLNLLFTVHLMPPLMCLMKRPLMVKASRGKKRSACFVKTRPKLELTSTRKIHISLWVHHLLLQPFRQLYCLVIKIIHGTILVCLSRGHDSSSLPDGIYFKHAANSSRKTRVSKRQNLYVRQWHQGTKRAKMRFVLLCSKVYVCVL